MGLSNTMFIIDYLKSLFNNNSNIDGSENMGNYKGCVWSRKKQHKPNSTVYITECDNSIDLNDVNLEESGYQHCPFCSKEIIDEDAVFTTVVDECCCENCTCRDS